MSRARRAVRIRLIIIAAAAVATLAAVVGLYACSRWRRIEGCRELAIYYGRATGLDPALVMAVIQAESAGDPKAVSRAGARGLMQLMPRTAAEVARKAGIDLKSPDALFDPELNVRLGTLYLAQQRRFFADDPWLYLAAYNAGPGNTDKWRLQNPDLPSRDLINRLAPAETRAYVPHVLKLWETYRAQFPTPPSSSSP